MRGTIAALAALAAALPAGGCGEDETGTPAACLTGPGAYLRALEAAPGEVRLGGATPISECLAEDQPPGELSQVSTATVGAATRLNERVRDSAPGGPASVRLGYLVGAVQEGASTTGGIHADLVIRLDAAARHTAGGGPLGVEFERAFGEGYSAGQTTG